MTFPNWLRRARAPKVLLYKAQLQVTAQFVFCCKLYAAHAELKPRTCVTDLTSSVEGQIPFANVWTRKLLLLIPSGVYFMSTGGEVLFRLLIIIMEQISQGTECQPLSYQGKRSYHFSNSVSQLVAMLYF